MSINQHLKEKINKRVLELFDKAHQNNDIQNINIRGDIMQKLLPYQTLHTFNMITALKNNTIVIDGSFTGTGKTYTTAAACAQLKLVPFVICPKSIISTWKNVLKLFGLDYIAVINYDSIRSLKYFDENGERVTCPYIKKDNNTFIWDFSSHPNRQNIVMIFDEVHKCKNHKSLNGKLLLSCRLIRTVMLSATLCDKNSEFGVFGMMLGFYKNYKHGKAWIESIIREDKNQYGKHKINTLHGYLFPEKGSKMALDDLGDSFPMNQISIDCYNLDPELLKKVNKYYQQISEENSNKLAIVTAMRQKIENIKVTIITDLMMDYYEQNRSIVVFVNYTSTYELIANYLTKKKIQYADINGRQDHDERQKNINKFQNNEVRIIVCMIQAGGMAISLHDVSGRFPRVSIISPSYSRIELIQTLGRIFRTGTKSPCLQKIVYCADTCEEDVANILRAKKHTLEKITDEDIQVTRNVIPCSGNNIPDPDVPQSNNLIKNNTAINPHAPTPKPPRTRKPIVKIMETRGKKNDHHVITTKKSTVTNETDSDSDSDSASTNESDATKESGSTKESDDVDSDEIGYKIKPDKEQATHNYQSNKSLYLRKRPGKR
jgi:superfamily II DNA or RNA helicase